MSATVKDHGGGNPPTTSLFLASLAAFPERMVNVPYAVPRRGPSGDILSHANKEKTCISVLKAGTILYTVQKKLETFKLDYATYFGSNPVLCLCAAQVKEKFGYIYVCTIEEDIEVNLVNRDNLNMGGIFTARVGSTDYNAREGHFWRYGGLPCPGTFFDRTNLEICIKLGVGAPVSVEEVSFADIFEGKDPLTPTQLTILKWMMSGNAREWMVHFNLVNKFPSWLEHRVTSAAERHECCLIAAAFLHGESIVKRIDGEWSLLDFGGWYYLYNTCASLFYNFTGDAKSMVKVCPRLASATGVDPIFSTLSVIQPLSSDLCTPEWFASAGEATIMGISDLEWRESIKTADLSGCSSLSLECFRHLCDVEGRCLANIKLPEAARPAIDEYNAKVNWLTPESVQRIDMFKQRPVAGTGEASNVSMAKFLLQCKAPEHVWKTLKLRCDPNVLLAIQPKTDFMIMAIKAMLCEKEYTDDEEEDCDELLSELIMEDHVTEENWEEEFHLYSSDTPSKKVARLFHTKRRQEAMLARRAARDLAAAAASGGGSA